MAKEAEDNRATYPNPLVNRAAASRVTEAAARRKLVQVAKWRHDLVRPVRVEEAVQELGTAEVNPSEVERTDQRVALLAERLPANS